MLKKKHYKQKKNKYTKNDYYLYKKERQYTKTRHNKPKKKAIFISYDDPRVRRILDIKVYQDYLKDNYTNSEGGADDE